MSKDFLNKLFLIISGCTTLVLIFMVANLLTVSNDVHKVSDKQRQTEIDHQAKASVVTKKQSEVDDSSDKMQFINEFQAQLKQKKTDYPTKPETDSNLPPSATEYQSPSDYQLNEADRTVVNNDSQTESTEPHSFSIELSQASDSVSSSTNNLEYSAKTPAIYPKISLAQYTDCGTLVVPSGLQLAMFALTVDNSPAVVCLGEAIAAMGCEESSARIVNEATELDVYVGNRPNDDVCSVGIAGAENIVTLCSVQKVMNTGSGENNSFSFWQSEFQRQPGKMFAKMYFDNQAAFSDLDDFSEVYDCATFQY